MIINLFNSIIASINYSQIIYLTIGAILSLIGSLGVMLIERCINSRGQINLYKKNVFIKNFDITCEICDNRLYVPTRIEIVNTKNTSVLLRNINLELFYNNKFKKKMLQMEEIGTRTSTNYGTYGNDKKYSIIVPNKSVSSLEFLYILDNQNKFEFNNIRLSFYDEKDKKHYYRFMTLSQGWSPQKKFHDKDCIKLEKL